MKKKNDEIQKVDVEELFVKKGTCTVSKIESKICEKIGLAGVKLTRKDVKKVFDAICTAYAETISSGEFDSVPVPKIGTLKRSERAERQGRNPHSGEAITIPAHVVVS